MAYNRVSFSRTRANESKLGAYYTDVAHCRDLRKLFHFPEDEVCVLEPCIGDGKAVIRITNADQNPNIKIFGVELNDAVAKNTKENPYVTDLIQADFTCDVMIRKNSFSFCFANPPYMEERSDLGESNSRLELVFLEKLPNYLKTGALLVWIVPENSFLDTSHLRLFAKHFEMLTCYRFRSEEYAKYKQIVVIGRRIAKREVSMSLVYELSQQFKDQITVLPDNLTEQFEVLPSYEADIDLFASRNFDPSLAHDFLMQNGIPDDVKQMINAKVTQKPFADTDLKRPPVPLKKDSLYLLATSGAGQGFTGSVEKKDLHLQRGIAEIIEESHENCDEDGNATTITVTTRTAISMHIVQNNGTITTLA